MSRPAQWTKENAATAVRLWIAEHGRTPTSAEWRPTPRGCPSRETLERLFGKWSLAMEAAGGEARRRGEYDRKAKVRVLRMSALESEALRRKLYGWTLTELDSVLLGELRDRLGAPEQRESDLRD